MSRDINCTFLRNYWTAGASLWGLKSRTCKMKNRFLLNSKNTINIMVWTPGFVDSCYKLFSNFSKNCMEFLLLSLFHNYNIFWNCVSMFRCEPWSVKRAECIAKSIDPCQSAQSAQADMSRYFSLSLNFLHAKRWFYLMIQNGCDTKCIL